MAVHNQIGILGERIAEKYLLSKGYTVKDRNYTKKWGEIDLIVEKNGVLHFVEVKTTRATIEEGRIVSYAFDPFSRISEQKAERLRKAITSFTLKQKNVGAWSVDALLVYVDTDRKEARVRLCQNIVL